MERKKFTQRLQSYTFPNTQQDAVLAVPYERMEEREMSFTIRPPKMRRKEV